MPEDRRSVGSVVRTKQLSAAVESLESLFEVCEVHVEQVTRTARAIIPARKPSRFSPGRGKIYHEGSAPFAELEAQRVAQKKAEEKLRERNADDLASAINLDQKERRSKSLQKMVDEAKEKLQGLQEERKSLSIALDDQTQRLAAARDKLDQQQKALDELRQNLESQLATGGELQQEQRRKFEQQQEEMADQQTVLQEMSETLEEQAARLEQ